MAALVESHRNLLALIDAFGGPPQDRSLVHVFPFHHNMFDFTARKPQSLVFHRRRR
jgi:hypothetical protein